MKKLLLKSLFAAALTVIALAGCKKEKTDDVDTDTSAAEDNAFAENTSSDIIEIGSQASDGNSSSLNSFRLGDADAVLSNCATVIHNTTLHIDSVIFNGNVCMDGRTRSGILIFNYSGSPSFPIHYRDPGFTCTVASNNYIVENN